MGEALLDWDKLQESANDGAFSHVAVVMSSLLRQARSAEAADGEDLEARAREAIDAALDERCGRLAPFAFGVRLSGEAAEFERAVARSLVGRDLPGLLMLLPVPRRPVLRVAAPEPPPAPEPAPPPQAEHEPASLPAPAASRPTELAGFGRVLLDISAAVRRLEGAAESVAANRDAEAATLRDLLDRLEALLKEPPRTLVLDGRSEFQGLLAGYRVVLRQLASAAEQVKAPEPAADAAALADRLERAAAAAEPAALAERLEKALAALEARGAAAPEPAALPSFVAERNSLERLSAGLATLLRRLSAQVDSLEDMRGKLAGAPPPVAAPAPRPEDAPVEPGRALVGLTRRLEALHASLEHSAADLAAALRGGDAAAAQIRAGEYAARIESAGEDAKKLVSDFLDIAAALSRDLDRASPTESPLSRRA